MAGIPVPQTDLQYVWSVNRLTTQYFHDSRSNLVFQVDAMGNPTRWTFDGLSRMIKVERALTLGATINDFTAAQVTQWGFDKNDRLISHKDDAPNESTWDPTSPCQSG